VKHDENHTISGYGLAKGNVFAERKNPETAKLFEDH
jgi:hypothetical protein